MLAVAALKALPFILKAMALLSGHLSPVESMWQHIPSADLLWVVTQWAQFSKIWFGNPIFCYVELRITFEQLGPAHRLSNMRFQNPDHCGPDLTVLKNWTHVYNHGHIALPLLPVHSKTCSHFFYISIYIHIHVCYVFLNLHYVHNVEPTPSSFMENCWNMLVGVLLSLLACLIYLGLQWVVTMVLLEASMEM